MSELVGKRVIVTGGAQGMGREHARTLSAKGARVAVVDLDDAALRETVDLVTASGGDIRSYSADVSDRDAIEKAIADVAAAWGGIDAIVSNAGNIHTRERLADTDDDTFWRTFRIHVGGALNLARAAEQHLIRSGAGRIVIVSSSWAQVPEGFGYGYSAAKGALIALMKNLAVELGPHGVCVNAIAPGPVPTRMAAGKPQSRIDEESKSIPLRRWARVDEVSGLVSFLCSDEASYVSGQTIGVNGALILSS